MQVYQKDLVQVYHKDHMEEKVYHAEFAMEEIHEIPEIHIMDGMETDFFQSKYVSVEVPRRCKKCRQC